MDKKKLVIILISLIILSVFLRFLSLNKDYSADESDFVYSALALRDTGRPLFYHSGQQPNELALWHPPFYIFMLSLILKLGENEEFVRSFNVLLCILCSLVIYLIAVFKLPKEEGKFIGLLSASLFLINYFVFSSSLVIDIDMSETFFLLLFIYFFLIWDKKDKKAYFYLSIFSLFLAIFNRFQIAFFVYAAVGFYYLKINKLNKKFKNYFLIGVLSLTIFLIIWGGYSSFIENGKFFSFFEHNLRLGSTQIADIKIYAFSFLLNISQIIRLFSLPFIILLIFSILHYYKNKNFFTNVIVIYALSSSLFFVLLPRPAFGFPRYFLSAMPAFCLLMGMFVYERLKNIDISKFLILPFILSLITLISLTALQVQTTTYSSDGLIKSTNLSDLAFEVFSSSTLLLILFMNKKKRKIIFIISLVFLFFIYSFYHNFSYVQSTEYDKEAGLYIKEHTQDQDLIIAPKSVGKYSERFFYANNNYKPRLDLTISYLNEYVKKSYLNPKMDEEFFWNGGMYGGLNYPIPDQETLKNIKYIVLYYRIEGRRAEKQIGDLYIYYVKN